MFIIKKVEKFIKKDVKVSDIALKVIRNSLDMKALLLVNNFDLFMENFENEL